MKRNSNVLRKAVLMTNNPNLGPSSFGNISETDRKRALDVFGQLIIEARDTTIRQWDGIVEGKGHYPPWDRLLQRHPEMDAQTREIIKEVVPHIVDSFMYCLLDELDGNQRVRVAVELDETMVEDISQISWGL